jgi:hypothetical protein
MKLKTNKTFTRELRQNIFKTQRMETKVENNI